MEYDERMTKAAEENRQRLFPGQKHHLYWRMQLFFRYRNPQTDFIFFNPFSVEILEKRHRPHPGILVRKNKRNATVFLLSI